MYDACMDTGKAVICMSDKIKWDNDDGILFSGYVNCCEWKMFGESPKESIEVNHWCKKFHF